MLINKTETPIDILTPLAVQTNEIMVLISNADLMKSDNRMSSLDNITGKGSQ